MDFYARKNQTVFEHITNVARLSKTFACVFNCGKTAYLAGLLHDLGKFTKTFQIYLKRSLEGENVTRGEVIHALQGAKFIEKNIKNPVVADILGNVIAAHHGGLFDCITDGESTLLVKTQKGEDQLHYAEAVKNFCPVISESEIESEIINFCKKGQQKGLNLTFMLHLLTKAIFSCVVDADRCDSAALTVNETIPDWAQLIQMLQSYLEQPKFQDDSAIGKARKSISEQCRQGAVQQQNIYTLSVPTGGGKTLSSLRFALEHAQKHSLKRIIYVIPYLSILDQTASELHKIFMDHSEGLILEHHSNMEVPEENDGEEQYRLLTSRWDSSIILTTMVQFLETIYSNKASKLRKFHNMSEAVIIFDEIQALPIKCVHLFNDAVNFLQTYSKSTILLCTATQPHLHETRRPLLLGDTPELVTLTPKEQKIFERVCIVDKTGVAMDHSQIYALAKKQIELGKSTLVILNTKADARKVYELSDSFDCEKTFLTTDLCPAHRLKILENLKKNLEPKTKRLTLCVSTQLIEAGVDISFDCVIRAEAGIDSIIQAAGRCNRNKENSTLQSVFVIDVLDENLSLLPEIEDGKNVTERVFRQKKDSILLSDEVVGLFYQYYFYNQKDAMDYNIKGNSTTIYSLLNDNPLGTIAYENRNNKKYYGLPCAFQTAADNFSVIEGTQTGIVVPFGNALQLVSDFQYCQDPKGKMRILKILQKFTVSVYSHTLEKLGKAISVIDNSFYLLSPDYYDTEEYGLLLEPKFSFYCV